MQELDISLQHLERQRRLQMGVSKLLHCWTTTLERLLGFTGVGAACVVCSCCCRVVIVVLVLCRIQVLVICVACGQQHTGGLLGVTCVGASGAVSGGGAFVVLWIWRSCLWIINDMNRGWCWGLLGWFLDLFVVRRLQAFTCVLRGLCWCGLLRLCLIYTVDGRVR